eukprot:TRINITY_DN1436_c1_g2_i1.p1 TRINITY_DN1436_c1_g2~~TRINITY_DN1436_c1_g2_i1.p1  ORF type:complete len:273 (+),score=71.13 TRINITY_DN1436_c1_g2_i1:91-819(+)
MPASAPEVGAGCWVCFHSYETSGGRRPLVLRCGHSVCDDCLKDIRGVSKRRNVIECPYCRRKSLGTEFPPNWALIEVVAAASPTGKSAEGGLRKSAAPLPEDTGLPYVAGVVLRNGVPFYALAQGTTVCLRRYSELHKFDEWIGHPALHAVFPPKGLFRPVGEASLTRYLRIREWMRRLSAGAESCGSWRVHLSMLLTPREGDVIHCSNPRELVRAAVRNQHADLEELNRTLQRKRARPAAV